MKTIPDLDEVQKCLSEISSYYQSCNGGGTRTVLISKSMLAFALELPQDALLNPVLLLLKERGAILAIADSMISVRTSPF